MGQIPVNKKKKMNMGIFFQQQWQTGNFKKKDEDDADNEEIRETDLYWDCRTTRNPMIERKKILWNRHLANI